MSFNVALSGIKSAASDLDVIGNNIANASTTAFKSSRTEFSDVYAASALGTSSVSIGNGVQIASVSQSFTQGTISLSSNNLDLAINGQGFFQLDDSGTTSYTRAGAFSVDQNGYIVNPTNKKLTGYLADATGNITGAIGDLQIVTSNLAPTATSAVGIGLNLQSTAPAPVAAWVGTSTFGGTPPAPNTYNNATSSAIYDSLGNEHILSAYYIKTSTPNLWDVRLQVDGVDVDASPKAAPFKCTFTDTGAFDPTHSDVINISWAPLNANGGANGAVTPQPFSLDLSASTQFGSPFALQSLSQNGASTGRLNSVDVDTTGIIFGRYSNGQSKPMGQVTLSNFSNPNGLEPLGDSTWGQTYASGSALVGEPGTSSLGVIQAGSLEDSNVDLTAELVNMIIAQRNFQASAQTIRTNDATTQTIINIR